MRFGSIVVPPLTRCFDEDDASLRLGLRRRLGDGKLARAEPALRQAGGAPGYDPSRIPAIPTSSRRCWRARRVERPDQAFSDWMAKVPVASATSRPLPLCT